MADKNETIKNENTAVELADDIHEKTKDEMLEMLSTMLDEEAVFGKTGSIRISFGRLRAHP